MKGRNRFVKVLLIKKGYLLGLVLTGGICLSSIASFNLNPVVEVFALLSPLQLLALIYVYLWSTKNEQKPE